MSMNTQSKDYFSKLLKTSNSSKKQIAVYFDDATIERIDMTIKLFSAISEANSFSRNTLIEEAVNKFLDESEEYLEKEMGLSVREELEEAKQKNNTVILSSVDRGFEETFMGEAELPCWYPCRCSTERIPSLKYIAIYRGAPVSSITHYAKIKEITYSKEKKCNVCYFEGGPIKLPHDIALGSKSGCFFRGAKYTSIESLLNATTADDIIFG